MASSDSLIPAVDPRFLELRRLATFLKHRIDGAVKNTEALVNGDANPVSCARMQDIEGGIRSLANSLGDLFAGFVEECGSLCGDAEVSDTDQLKTAWIVKQRENDEVSRCGGNDEHRLTARELGVRRAA